MLNQSCSDNVLVMDHNLSAAGSKPAAPDPESQGVCSSRILDGMQDPQSLITVLKRVVLACTVYGAASSMFVFAFMLAINFCMFGWGPLEMARANALFVIYFGGIMVPFAVLLAWLYRYKKALPYQQKIVEINLPYTESYYLALGAALSVKGAELLNADEQASTIHCRAPRRKNAGVQEITVQLEPVSEDRTRILLSSEPLLNAIEHALFGYTLAVDGGQNKANVDIMLNFLKDRKTA